MAHSFQLVVHPMKTSIVHPIAGWKPPFYLQPLVGTPDPFLAGKTEEGLLPGAIFHSKLWMKHNGTYGATVQRLYPNMFTTFNPCLPGWWFGTLILFSHILGIIIPIDLYFSEGFKPPTSYNLFQLHNILG